MTEQFATYMHRLAASVADPNNSEEMPRLAVRVCREDAPGRGLRLFAVPAGLPDNSAYRVAQYTPPMEGMRNGVIQIGSTEILALPSEAGRVLRRKLEAIGWVVTGVA